MFPEDLLPVSYSFLSRISNFYVYILAYHGRQEGKEGIKVTKDTKV